MNLQLVHFHKTVLILLVLIDMVQNDQTTRRTFCYHYMILQYEKLYSECCLSEHFIDTKLEP